MTGMDLNLARMPAASDAGAVQSVTARGDDEGAADAGDGFHNALKTVANDKHGKEQTAEGRAAQKAGAGKSRDAIIERLRQLEAAAKARDGEDAHQASGKVRSAEDVAAGELGDETDVEDISEEKPATVAEAATDSAEKALALILGHVSTHGNGEGRKDAKSDHDKASAAAPAEMPEPAAVDDKPLRNVTIASTKVETHFAPLATPAIAASLAHKIADMGAAGAAGKVQDAKAGGAGSTAKTGTDQLATLKDLDFAQAGPEGRGKLVAGAERRGTDGSGSGKGSNADAKPSAEIGEPKAVGAAADGLAAMPGQGATPMEQLGHRVASVAHELRNEAAAHVGSTGADTTPGPGPVRVLSINLHPEELGSVTVRMSLVRDALEVQIEAEHPSTAKMLTTDSSALSDMLRSAGIQVDGITVRAAAPDTVSANTGSSQSMLDQQSQGGAGADARANGGRQNGQQEFGERTSGRKGYEDDTSQRGVAGGLYV